MYIPKLYIYIYMIYIHTTHFLCRFFSYYFVNQNFFCCFEFKSCERLPLNESCLETSQSTTPKNARLTVKISRSLKLIIWHEHLRHSPHLLNRILGIHIEADQLVIILRCFGAPHDLCLAHTIAKN